MIKKVLGRSLLEHAEIKDLSFRMTDSVAGIYVSQDINRIKD